MLWGLDKIFGPSVCLDHPLLLRRSFAWREVVFSDMNRPLRRSLLCLMLFALTVAAGIAVRFAPLHLSPFLYKYLGSALWAVALYWFAGMLLPRLPVRMLAAVSVAIALLVEFSRLMPERHVDAFRLTLAGKLLLGRYFAWKNILAYLLGIAVAALVDNSFVFANPSHPRRSPRQPR